MVRNAYSWRIAATLVGLLYALTVFAADPSFHSDITYATVDGVELKLDLAAPATVGGRCPLVLCVHGGAWSVGDKSRLDGFIKLLATHGYVGATINYRFAPKYKFPAQLDDARAALHYLRLHATEYQIDPDHIAAAGESAGAQIAMLLAMRHDASRDPADNATPVQCVLNYFGPTDFSKWQVTPFHELLAHQLVHKSIAQIMEDLFGTGDLTSPIMAAASPVHFVSPAAPPIISFHGAFDPIVPFQQAQLLHDALRKAGVKEKLVQVSGGHGRWPEAVRANADQQAINWLDEYLKSSTQHATGYAEKGRQ